MHFVHLFNNYHLVMWWSMWYLLVLKQVTGGTETSFRSEEFRQSKESFQLAEEEVELIFSKIVNRLRAQTKKLRAKLPFDFAETSFKKIEDNGGKLPANVERKLRKSGVIIVRNTLPPKEAVDLASSTIEYLYQNGAFPNSTSDNDVRDFLLKILSFSSILSSNYRKYKFKQAFF